MKLHIGCGKTYLPPQEGWINHDLFESVKADVYAEISSLPFPPNTFTLIYASHVLEHCHRHCLMATLTHWRYLLKPGGVLRIAVPDFEAISRYYERTRDLKPLMGLLYGGQNHPKNSHCLTFDETTLSTALLKAGFSGIQRWDWRKTDHSQFDDYSQCYLPHMDKEHGECMSLNLEACA